MKEGLAGREMTLTDVLHAKKGEIVKRSYLRVTETYSDGIASFLKKETDPLVNPLGSTITRTLEALLAELIEGGTPGGFRLALEGLVKMRAVLSPSPSDGLSLIGFLKQAIRDEVEAEVARGGTTDRILPEYLALEERLDEAMLIACNLYVGCREKVDEMRISEVKAEKERLLRVIRAMNGRNRTRGTEKTAGPTGNGEKTKREGVQA